MNNNVIPRTIPKSVKFDVIELDTQTAWIIGSKHKIEKVFFHQIVYSLKQKQRLWQLFTDTGTDFFFQEIELPFRLKQTTTPF